MTASSSLQESEVLIMPELGLTSEKHIVHNFENEDLANTSQITEYNDKVDATDELHLEDVHESREASSEVPKESSEDLMEEDKIREYNDDINNEEGSYPQKLNIVAEVGSLVGMKHDIKTENKVLQKLTRVPRYFDPPEWFFPESDDCDLNNYNSERCKVQRKRRTCYICGDNGHDGKCCKKVNACFICFEKGHLVTDCPNKNLNVDCASRLCLLCGDMGHDMLSCTNGYDSEDLKNIQCYICKEFGHLCCVDSKSEEVREVSCYRCGESGHLGFECVKLEGVTNDSQSVQLCAECRERGHSLKECIKCMEANTSKTARKKDTAKRSKSEKRRARKARRAARNRTWLADNAFQSQPNWAHSRWRPQIVGPYYGKPGSNVWLSPAARSNFNHLAPVQGLPSHEVPHLIWNQTPQQPLNHQAGVLPPHQPFSNQTGNQNSTSSPSVLVTDPSSASL